jgi:hypothetical protein
MICYQTGRMSVGDLITAFERLAESADPFGQYPIVYPTPSQ